MFCRPPSTLRVYGCEPAGVESLRVVQPHASVLSHRNASIDASLKRRLLPPDSEMVNDPSSSVPLQGIHFVPQSDWEGCV